MNEIVFSRRSDFAQRLAAAKAARTPDQSPRPREELKAEARRLFEAAKATEYIPVPQRLEAADKLIDYAARMAKALDLNMDIRRCDDCVELQVYDDGPFFSEEKDFLGELFLFCDSVAIYRPGEDGAAPEASQVIAFTLSTHRLVVDGRDISLF